MTYRPRILHGFCIAASVLLCLKLADIGSAVFGAGIGEAHAQVQPAARTPAAASPSAKPAPAAPAGTPAQVQLPARHPEPSDSNDALEALAERRAELDRRAVEITKRAGVLKAAEKRIDEKIAKLESLEKSIGAKAQKQDEEEEARLQSLVRIYEKMKPKDAARIFEKLDMPVLLEVVERMKERITAPILASMDPAKARAVTLALAERKARPIAQK